MHDHTSAPHLAGVQYLRGVAATMVVAYHAVVIAAEPQNFGQAPFGGIFGGGFVGVEIFFAISGFIIALVSLSADGRPRLSPTAFLARRALRLLPLLWCVVVATFGIRFALGEMGDPLLYVRAAFLLPGPIRPPVAWTLRNEWFFYGVFALAFLGKRRRLWLVVAWVALMVALTDLRALGIGPPWRAALLILCSPRNLCFVAGLTVGLAYVRWRPTLTLPPAAFAACSVLAAAASGVHLVIPRTSTLEHGVALMGLCLPLIVIAALVRGDRGGVLHRVGLRLGDASYSVYLGHSVVMVAAFRAAAPLRDHLSGEVVSILATVVAVVWGLLLHRWVEVPVTAAARRLASQWARPRTAPASA